MHMVPMKAAITCKPIETVIEIRVLFFFAILFFSCAPLLTRGGKHIWVPRFDMDGLADNTVDSLDLLLF